MNSRYKNGKNSSTPKIKEKLMITEIHKFIAITILPLFLLSGCMTFQSNDARKYSSFPPPLNIQAPKESKTIHISTRYQVIGRHGSAYNIEGWMEDKLNETGVFIVHPDDKIADYSLHIRVRNHTGVNIGPAIIAGVTLFIFPAKDTNSYTTDFKLIDKKGNLIANKRFKHELVSWYQLLLILGTPFATHKGASEDMWDEILKDAAVWVTENAK